MKFILATFLCVSSAFAIVKSKKEEVPYRVQFSARLPQQIYDTIEEHATLFTLAKRLPTSMAALRFRVERDLPKIKEILFAYGYYDAQIQVEFSKRHDSVIVVLFQVILNDRYTLSSFRVINNNEVDKVDPTTLISAKRVGIKINEPMDAYQILNAEKLLIKRLGHIGYPFAKVEKLDVLVNQKNKTVAVTIYASPGPFAYFGSTTIEGLNKVNPRYAKYLLAWKEGKPFDIYLIDQTRDSYFDTTLFSYVNIAYPDKLDSNGQLPITLNVKESLFRSVNLGVNYATLDGYGFSLGWEHRNILGLGQKFSLQADISVKTKYLAAVYKKANIKKRGEFFTYRAVTAKNEYIAYEAKNISLKRRVDRNMTLELKRSWAVVLEFLKAKTAFSNNRFLLLSLPFSLRYNTTKDHINPRSGHILDIGTEPTVDFRNIEITYLKNYFSYSFFSPLSINKKAILAFRAYFGTIFGLPLNKIPVPKRFFAGTQEFLRGYTYLTVSPLNVAGNPIGGRSMMMYNLELRLNSSDDWGIVLFYDFGQVFKQNFIRFDQGLLNSLGIGLRYFTLAGPVSLDFAFPLNPRAGLEDSLLKIYVNIGQTF